MRKNHWLALTGAASVLAALAGAAPRPSADPDRVLRLFAEEFVALTPGAGKFPASFTMGTAADAPAAEKPATKVTFRAPFAMARHEVTQELYEAVMGGNPSKWKGPRNSVEMVNWDEAVDFCRKATALLRERKLLAPGDVVRLPSEAEWEYACRAGTTTAYSFGDDAAALKDYAWFKANSKGEDPPVGRKKPNAWGLYDMHGYVWEWCADAWSKDHAKASPEGSPRASKDAKERVLRGGSYSDEASDCRSATRVGKPADFRSDTIGFRCVRAAAKP